MGFLFLTVASFNYLSDRIRDYFDVRDILLHETNDANNILELNDYRVGFRTERGLAKAVDGVSLSLNAVLPLQL